LVKELEHTNNYVLTTSNVFVITIKDTRNYADRLDLCLKVLEGTEGPPVDIILTPPLPRIPPTGIIAIQQVLR
jgi:hypothetical protein